MALRFGRTHHVPKLLALLVGGMLAALTSFPLRDSKSKVEVIPSQTENIAKESRDVPLDGQRQERALKPESEIADSDAKIANENTKSGVKPKVPPANKPKPAPKQQTQPKKIQKEQAKKPSQKKETVPENLLKSTVVNPHPFKVLISNDDLCKVDDLFLIVYVHTAADHYKRRAIIRQTWGNPANYPNFKMRILFVMGKTSQVPMMQKAIEFESETYKDILEEDFEDTYKNLTFKGIAALKWISTHCNNAHYILKTDDDVFVNMYTVINHLSNIDNEGHNKKLILCLVWWKMHALREGKWAIPLDMYPYSLYPPYCSGMAYILSTDVAKTLYDVSQYVEFFWVDDVYVSGMLPKAADLQHVSMIKVYCGKNEMEDLFSHPTEWHKYAFTHIHDEDKFMRTWDQLTSLAKANPIPRPNKIEPGWLADEYKPKNEIVKPSS